MSRQEESLGKEEKKFSEKLIELKRVTKVVKGGRRFSFSALVVVGDQQGLVGVGFGKANDVVEAIRKGVAKAKKNLLYVPLKKGGVLPHEVWVDFKSTRLYVKPATKGTGIIAGGCVRSIMEAVGVHDVLTKLIGSTNTHNTADSVMLAFRSLLRRKPSHYGA